MGNTHDRSRRENIREDNSEIRRKIDLARSFIFKKGYGPEDEAIKKLLDEFSLVPVRVGFTWFVNWDALLISFPERILHSFR